ncbi:hypothetical protein SLEP1_g48769 [Rubroshorea leprosula]|uniref:Uncharacterized protein n=1 Tax=Rubroshorea leprosula TaxID=152421 RepID=A0AAV5LVJ5_9ROSI|nr:hypothetical protein SLEP1_g48769 [Rubroshorea leprosula]
MEHDKVGVETKSFRSERTEEGMGKEKMDGEEGIPFNILEVEGEQSRCYDDTTDIGSEANNGGEKVCLAPNDHWMPIYAHYLVAGLRFPILGLLPSNSSLPSVSPSSVSLPEMVDKENYEITQ